jgi:hypothetical protein
MLTANYKIFDAVLIAGSPVSIAIGSNNSFNATVQATFTDAAAAGTLKLQASNDPINPTNWSDITGASVVVVAGALVITPSVINHLCYQFIRAVFTRTAGAGTITAYLQTTGG